MNAIGDIRPSQLIFTFGIGSILDLPNISALVMGLDEWDTGFCTEITEERLLAALQKRLGYQLKRLYLPPTSYEETISDPTKASVGVPVVPFPRWLRCPVCNTLATIDSGIFTLAMDHWKPDQTRFVHASCTKGHNPKALSVRFLMACREGHLTDFPWAEYVHSGRTICKPARLTMQEYGVAGDASDIIVNCLECGAERRMGDAFDRERFQFECGGHHPHLRLISEERCPEEAKTILLGASNSWFPVVMSALSIPTGGDKLSALVADHWAELRDIPSLEVLKYVAAPSRMPWFAGFSVDEIWAAIKAKKEAPHGTAQVQIQDLKEPEWDILTQADTAGTTDFFKLRRVATPKGFEQWFEDTILVERIREVRALMGFTRIESKGDFADAAYQEDERLTPLSRESPSWLPVSEVHGEGIFIRLKESLLSSWETHPDVSRLNNLFLESHRTWRRLRKLEPHDAGYPGIRFVLIHSLAHALMRQIVLDCGYTAASLRERIYCKERTVGGESMAGFLLYTAASDNEGTLGGLVSLGDPISLGRHIDQALENLRLCASDPLCSERTPSSDGRGIHGACCHACLFASETSCERGNRYLDRSTLVQTFVGNATGFFEKKSWP